MTLHLVLVMIEAILSKVGLVLGPIGIALIAIVLYGNRSKKLGESKARHEIDNKQMEREKQAKAIESEPAPTDPDDVADMFERLRVDDTKAS